MAVDGHSFMTKTQHYRKVTKPLLERKRRARMNLYLEELKSLIMDTMEAEGDHINKLEKADILEMTVNYLKIHKRQLSAQGAVMGDQSGNGSPDLNVEKFRAGYTQAAYEVSNLFATLPGLDLKFGARLLKHLGYNVESAKQSPNSRKRALEAAPTNATQPVDYHVPKAKKPKREEATARLTPSPVPPKPDDVWRPW